MTKLEQVYGGSLYALAEEEGRTKEILQELRQISGLFRENPDYVQFLSTVSIAKEARCKALDEAFGGRVEPYVLNFMKLLCENGYMNRFDGCVKEYIRLYNRDNDIVQVCAVTAVPMGTELKEALREKLQAVLGKTVELESKVDKACVGGVRLELPDRRLDGTVKNRLDKLAAALQGAAV